MATNASQIQSAEAWQLKIYDPSGEVRTVRLEGQWKAGAPLGSDSEEEGILLRDPTLPRRVAQLWAKPETHSSRSPWWIRLENPSVAAQLGGIDVREAELPPGIPLRLGETTLQMEAVQTIVESIPPFPSGVRPWLSCTREGKDALWTARKAASTSLSVYLAGETGTGKEVMAQLIHSWSERSSGPFVPLHCGALPLSLAESELFGHVKGAFTGAIHQRPGALMQAHNGTLFLDEVGDLPADIQVKLLRFLENGEIRAVGADRPSRADVRLICATHLPLKKLVEEGRFRRDLYFRLASITVEIPNLRSRPDDVVLLARRFGAELGRSLSPRALLRLQAHSWPGNVRELRHAMERASGLGSPFQQVLDEDAFSFLLAPDHIEENPELELGTSVLSLAEMERIMLLKALRLSQGNRAKASKILGVARSTLFEMLKRHRIQGPRSAPVAATG